MYLEDHSMDCRKQVIVPHGFALPPDPSHQGRGDIDEGKSEEKWIRSLFATQSVIGEHEI